MKGLILLFFTLINCAFAQLKYLPDNRDYSSQDTGYLQYATPSLYKTGKYVLTFDDGPHITRTPKILDILKKKNIKATFFIITSRINPATAPIIKRMIDEGHTVANHGVEHHNSNTITVEDFKQNIKLGFLTLKNTLALYNIELDKFYYRFPYAAYGTNQNYHHLNAIRELSQELFSKNCIHFVFWDHDSADWVPGITPEEVTQNIQAAHIGGSYTGFTLKTINGKKEIIKVKKDNYQAYAGGIILFHDIQLSTVNSIENTLNYFEENLIDVIELGHTQENSAADFKNCSL